MLLYAEYCSPISKSFLNCAKVCKIILTFFSGKLAPLLHPTYPPVMFQLSEYNRIEYEYVKDIGGASLMQFVI
jgi:hypothetical protein